MHSTSSEEEIIELTDEDNRRILWKIDLNLLSVSLCWIRSQLLMRCLAVAYNLGEHQAPMDGFLPSSARHFRYTGFRCTPLCLCRLSRHCFDRASLDKTVLGNAATYGLQTDAVRDRHLNKFILLTNSQNLHGSMRTLDRTLRPDLL